MRHYMNHKENERRQESLRIHRAHVVGGGTRAGFWYGNNKGKTQFGRTKIGLVNNIKMDLKVTELEETE